MRRGPFTSLGPGRRLRLGVVLVVALGITGCPRRPGPAATADVATQAPGEPRPAAPVAAPGAVHATPDVAGPQPSSTHGAAAVDLAGAATSASRVGAWSGAIDHGRPMVPLHGDDALRAVGPLGERLLALRHDPPTEGLRHALELRPSAGAGAIAVALRHESPQVRIGACRLLGAVPLGDARLRAALVALMRQDPDRDVRVAAVTALIGRHEAAYAETLASLLLGDDAARVRAAAAWALGTNGDASSAAPLVGALQDRDAMTRLGAVASLDRLRARDRLVQILALRDDPDPRVRRAVVRAAQHLGADHASPAKGDNDAMDLDR